jgi:sulfofructose kinase
MTRRSPVEVLVTGLNIVDVLARLPETVRHGEKHEIRDLLIQGGGPAGNAACVMAALGWRTGFIARMGNDTLSGIARTELTRHGVLDDYLIPDDTARPGMALVEVDPISGERTVFYTLNGYRSLKPADIPVEDVKQAKLILVDGYETDAAFAMLAATRGTPCRSVLDVEAGDPKILRRLIELGTDVILPLGAAQRLSGESDPAAALHKLRSWTQGLLLTTDGVNGSWALADGEIYHQPVFKVTALDTTGCGDAYHGGYASALLAGWPLPLRMEFAAWVAAQVALCIGGRSNLPNRQAAHAAVASFSPALQLALSHWS